MNERTGCLRVACKCIAGLSLRIKEVHALEIANLALDFQTMIRQRRFITHGDRCIELKIGINTGESHRVNPVENGKQTHKRVRIVLIVCLFVCFQKKC